jgi:hypothetical protein
MPDTVLAPAEKAVTPKPKNRYEHQITLTAADLAEMGMQKGPQVGDKKKLKAVAEVIGVSKHEDPEAEQMDVRVTIQLREIAFMEEESEESRNTVIANKLFGG